MMVLRMFFGYPLERRTETEPGLLFEADAGESVGFLMLKNLRWTHAVA